jgi:ribosomal-protein-alanine N-acetyltransferase
VLLLAVVEGVRRRGVGSALLETALEAAHRAGAPVAHLEVRAANRVAQAFYRHHGFEVVGRRRRYYEGRQDAVLMTRMLA